MLYTAYLVDQIIFEWGEEVKEMMSFDVELTEEILAQIEQNLLNRLVNLKLHQYFQLSEDTQALMLSAVEPRIPSENIFSKDPIEAIEEYLLSNCTDVGDSKNGVTLKNI